MGRPRLDNKKETCSFSLDEDSRELLKAMSETYGISASACVSTLIRETEKFGDLPMLLGMMKTDIISSCKALIAFKEQEIRDAQAQIDTYKSILERVDKSKARIDALNEAHVAEPTKKTEVEIGAENCHRFLVENMDSIFRYLGRDYENYAGSTYSEKFDMYLLKFRRECYKLSKLGMFTDSAFKAPTAELMGMFEGNAIRYATETKQPVEDVLCDFTDPSVYRAHHDMYYETVDREVAEIRSGRW